MNNADQIEQLELNIEELEAEIKFLRESLREEENQHFVTQGLYTQEYTMRKALERECGRKGWELI